MGQQRLVALRQVVLVAAGAIVAGKPAELRQQIASGLDFSQQIKTVLANPLYAQLAQSLRVLTEQDVETAVTMLRTILPAEYIPVLDDYRGWLEQQFKLLLKVVKQA